MADKIRVYLVSVQGRTYRVEVGDLSRSPVEVKVDGEVFSVELPQAEVPPGGQVPARSPTPVASVSPVPQPGGASQVAQAPMPGKILAVRVKVGDQVHRGDELYVLEAMKMEQVVRSAVEGVVRAVLVQEGQAVAYGDTMVEFA